MAVLTADDKKRIHEALKTANGSQTLAAQLLGIEPKTLRNHITNNPELQAVWAQRGAVTEPKAADLAARVPPERLDDDEIIDLPGAAPALPADVSAKDMTLARQQEAQDQKLRKLNWDGIGITGSTKQLMESFTAFTGGKILSTLDATHGGMLFAYAKTAERFAYLSQKLGDPVTKESPALEANYSAQWVECAKLMEKFNTAATRAGHVRALIAQIAVKETGKGGRQRKAGWLSKTKTVGGKSS